MSTPRRNFLKTCAMSAVAAGLFTKPPLLTLAQDKLRRPVPRADHFRVPYEAKTDRVFYFTKSTFTPYLDTDFTVRAGALVVTLRLIEVEECTADAPKDAGECFALTFRADRELSKARTIHTFEHGALGEFNFFVSATKKFSDPDGLYYVAVINHRLESPGPLPKNRKLLRPEPSPVSKPRRNFEP